MNGNSLVISYSAAAVILLTCTVPLFAAPMASASPAKVHTVLYDAFGKTPGIQKDWGYSAFIEYAGKRILFDTGNNSDILAENARAKGIDLSKLDFVVMSHRHGDHMGGLAHLLKVNPTVKIYAPRKDSAYTAPTCQAPFIVRIPRFHRNSATMTAFHRKLCDWGRPGPARTFNWSTNTEIVPDIHLIALVSDKPGTLELRELSLAINTPEGMVIIVGCSHPGIDKIVAAASAINPRIDVIAGGFHLVVTSDADMGSSQSELRRHFRVHPARIRGID